MPKTVFTLDSRNRINAGGPVDCQFLLQDTVLLSKMELINFSYANTLFNVTSYSNTLFINGVLAATIIPRFFTALAFVAELNAQLKVFYGTAAEVVTRKLCDKN